MWEPLVEALLGVRVLADLVCDYLSDTCGFFMFSNGGNDFGFYFFEVKNREWVKLDVPESVMCEGRPCYNAGFVCSREDAYWVGGYLSDAWRGITGYRYRVFDSSFSEKPSWRTLSHIQLLFCECIPLCVF